MPSRGSFESVSPAFLQLFLVVAFLLCWCAWSSIWALSGLESEFILCAHMEKIMKLHCTSTHKLRLCCYSRMMFTREISVFSFFPLPALFHIYVRYSSSIRCEGENEGSPQKSMNEKLCLKKEILKMFNFSSSSSSCARANGVKANKKAKKKQFPSFVSRYQQFFFSLLLQHNSWPLCDVVWPELRPKNSIYHLLSSFVFFVVGKIAHSTI